MSEYLDAIIRAATSTGARALERRAGGRPLGGLRLDSAYLPLKITFGLVPLLAGLDKFFNILTDWKSYLGPALAEMLSFGAADKRGAALTALSGPALTDVRKACLDELLALRTCDAGLRRGRTASF